MDYKNYQLSVKEEVYGVLASIVVTIAIAILFYRSGWACLIFPFVHGIIRKEAKEKGQEIRMQQMQEQFLNGIKTLNTSLQAGMSMETAWREVEKETKLLYGEDSLFYQEIAGMNNSVSLNIPIEKLFMEFANRTGMEDLMQFAETFDYGKRSGGNWIKIIESTVYRMSEKYEAKQQIEIMVAEKKMEQQIMNLMPLGIVGFLQISAWDYMASLYHNWFGVISMSIFLLVYVVAMALSQRILKVEV